MQKPTSTPDPRDGTITRKEARDLLHALDKPEFSGLMDNYINEISDPNNIKETNQFLKESEERKDLPSNVKLCKPTPGFCIKSEKYNIKRPGNRQKVFINICSYDEVPEPKSDSNNMWSLPHLLNKGRHDQDKNKKVCTTFDVVFNSKAIKLSNENIAFKKFVCDTAINGINNQLLAKTEEKISSDFVVKTKFNYKGLEVAYINIHSLNKGEMDDRKEPNEFHKTEIMKEVEKIKNESKKEDKKEEEDDDEEKVYDQPDVGEINKDIKIQKEIDINNKVPIYKIKYSNTFDINNFFYQPEGVNEVQENYKRMIIDIETPRMNSAGDAELEVDIKQLKFSYKDIYKLDIALPIEIKKETVRAKFDKTKKILSISADINRKEVVMPKPKEDENIEIVKDDEEQRQLEREQKRKEEEEKKKKEKEEEELRRQEEERKEKEKKILEAKKKREEEEKNKEVIIKGKKEEVKKEDLPLKEVKYKIEDNKEEKKTKEKEENKKLVQEVTTTNEKAIVKHNQKDEDDEEPTNNNQKENTSITPTRYLPQDENKTPLVFLNFNNDWVYEVE